jgi:hypothetical protein
MDVSIAGTAWYARPVPASVLTLMFEGAFRQQMREGSMAPNELAAIVRRELTTATGTEPVLGWHYCPLVVGMEMKRLALVRMVSHKISLPDREKAEKERMPPNRVERKLKDSKGL